MSERGSLHHDTSGRSYSAQRYLNLQQRLSSPNPESSASEGTKDEASGKPSSSAAERLAAFSCLPTNDIDKLTVISCKTGHRGNLIRQTVPNKLELTNHNTVPLKSPKVLFTRTSVFNDQTFSELSESSRNSKTSSTSTGSRINSLTDSQSDSGDLALIDPSIDSQSKVPPTSRISRRRRKSSVDRQSSSIESAPSAAHEVSNGISSCTPHNLIAASASNDVALPVNTEPEEQKAITDKVISPLTVSTSSLQFDETPKTPELNEVVIDYVWLSVKTD